jgi:predicted DNA binding protein
MPDLLNVDKARKELDQKDLQTIERETALTWGGRAAASYACSLEDSGSDHAEAMRCFWEGETYRAEALEHAAMTEDPRLLERLTTEIESYRAKARDALVRAGHAFVQGGRTPRGQRPAQGPAESRPAKGERVVNGAG